MQRKMAILGAVAGLIALTGCGDDDARSGPDCSLDSMGPMASIVPESPARVVADDGTVTIQVNFSEDVTGVTAASFTGATVSSVDGAESSYRLTLADLVPGSSVSVTLASAGVADVCGNPMAADFTFQLEVVADVCAGDTSAPQVRAIPSSPITLDADTTMATVQLLFNEPVMGVDGALAVDNGASIDSVTFNNGVYDVALSSIMEGMTTLTAAAAITDVCGNALAETGIDIVVPITDVVPPTVASTNPADMAVDVNYRMPIEVVFSEAMDITAGTAEIAMGTITPTPTWSADGTTLTLTPPESGWGFTADVSVTLTGYADTTGNALAMPFTFSFTTGADPCTGIAPVAQVVNSVIEADGTGGMTSLAFRLDNPFMITEALLSLTATSGGAGVITAGSLMGMGTDWTIDVTGVADGDTYTLNVAEAVSGGDMCTTLTGRSVPVAIRTPLPTTSGMCPLPTPLANHFADVDMCDARTNATVANAANTGFTLANRGDEFSIGGIYDSDTIDGSDMEFYTFDVTSSGTTVNDISVSFVYGCNFTGTGTRSTTSAPEIELLDASGATIATFDGNDTYGDVDGSGNFGYGMGTASVILPPGTSTLTLTIDDISGTAWCMDFGVYVRLEDNTRPAGCSGIPSTIEVAGAPQSALQPPGAMMTTLSIPLTAPFPLQESDITLMATSGGAGTLVAGSFAGSGSVYTIDLMGAMTGETYDLFVAGGSGTCSRLNPGFIPVTITSEVNGPGSCPLPGALPNHFPAPDACGATATNSSFANSAATGFTLTAVGDEFSIGGTYDSDGSDFDFFSFQLTESGTVASDVEVTIVYGCAFTGTGTRSSTEAPEVRLYDNTNTSLDFFEGDQTYGNVDGSGMFGFGREVFRVGGAAGTNTYHLRIDDILGSGWCMDYSIYVELLNNTTPIACVDAGLTSAVAAPGVAPTITAGTATIPIELDGDFQLLETDLTFTATSGGTGSIVAGSLMGSGSSWTVGVTGVMLGETYTLALAGRTDSCMTALAPGTIGVSFLDLVSGSAMCPFPATFTNHFADPDACDARTNATLATAAATGFTLMSSGDAFSVAGIYDSDSIGGSDNEWYEFTITGDGTSAAVLDIRAVYGCSFTGTGTPGGFTPIFEIRNSSGSQVGVDVDGSDNYDVIDGSGNFGWGGGTVTIPASELAAGPNTFYLWVDDDVGSSWCMDFQAYVTRL